MSKRKYDDDDGRRIADMSGVSPQAMFMPRLPGEETASKAQTAEASPAEDRPWEKSGISRSERRQIINAALAAALLIAGVFIAVLGIAIWLMIAWWS